MGILEKALPREKQPNNAQEAVVQSPKGVYAATFIGMTDPYEWVSQYANEPCRLCKGQGTGYNGEGVCRQCAGSRKRTEQRTKLRYTLANGILEEEEINFKLSAPSVGKNGQPLSPSTLFVRLRTLSGIANATEEQLDAWYSSLPKPIAIPCTVIIDDNKTGSYLKITNVLLLPSGAAGQPNAQPAGRSFAPSGNGAAAEGLTQTYQPALLDAALNDRIMAVAIDVKKLTSSQWTTLLIKHTGGEFTVGKTTAAQANALLDDLNTQEDEIPF